MKTFALRILTVAIAVTVASCGGDSGNDARYDSMVSFGDSVSDVGTYKVGTIAALTATEGGGRWVTSTPAGGEIWVEQLSARLNLPKPCPAQTGLFPNIPGITGAPIVVNTSCRNYAQGSSRITNPAGPNSLALQAAGQVTLGLTAKPVRDQMAAHLSAAGGRYSGPSLPGDPLVGGEKATLCPRPDTLHDDTMRYVAKCVCVSSRVRACEREVTSKRASEANRERDAVQRKCLLGQRSYQRSGPKRTSLSHPPPL